MFILLFRNSIYLLYLLYAVSSVLVEPKKTKKIRPAQRVIVVQRVTINLTMGVKKTYGLLNLIIYKYYIINADSRK